MTYLLRDHWAIWVTIFCTRQSFGRGLIRDSSTNTAPISRPPHFTEASHQKLCSERTLITSYSAGNTYLHEIYNMVTTNGLQRLALSACIISTDLCSTEHSSHHRNFVTWEACICQEFVEPTLSCISVYLV